MKKNLLILLLLIVTGTMSLHGQSDTTRLLYQDREMIIVSPAKAAAGNPWIWRPAFFGAFDTVDSALLGKGFHVVYYDLTHLYGSPRSVRLGNDFYRMICRDYHLSDKVTLEGFSRGGYFVFNWAAANPDKVACIYADAPVCDILSWPGRKDSVLWNGFLKEWDLQDSQVDSSFRGNVIHTLPILAAARIPIISVCGDSDRTVPYTENMKKIRDAYQDMGGVVELILKHGCDHHPHSLTDPEPVVDFILRYQKGYTEQQHIQQRGDLTNAFSRFIKEKKGCVAFLGGSITEMRGWRNMIEEDLKQRFPYTDFTFIDAGISSTGSTPHAFRLENDVIDKGTPDLMFVEAAVNDDVNGFTAVEQIRGMEGIVRHALLTNPEMDIVMLHFIHDPFIPIFGRRQQPEVITNHERVADYYHITSINLAQEIAGRMQSGELTWQEFGGVHPAWNGHKYYAASINHLFDDACRPLKALTIRPHQIPVKPMDRFSYDRGAFIDIRQARALKGFEVVADWSPSDDKASTRKGFVHVPLLVTEKAGSSLEIEFTGRAIGIFCVPGPQAGIIEYRIDGNRKQRLDTHTQWSDSVYLPWVYMLGTELEEGAHKLYLKMTKSARNECLIRNFVINR